jgi:hypothetical protein
MGWSFHGMPEELWRLSPILDVRSPDRAASGVPMVEVELPDQTDRTRRRALAQLDILLDQLERTTLRGDPDPPRGAIDALRALGIGDVERYGAGELVDIVLHAQWSLPHSRPAPSIEERQAVVREARFLWERGAPGLDDLGPPVQLAADGQL